MDPHGPIAQRFPLISRFRPACLPLPRRVHSLVELADAAAARVDQGLASAVYNQAALLASDLGLPALAREMCCQHAAAYLHVVPLPGMTAIRALEPVVNLARLQIRAGSKDDGRHHLLILYNAVTTGASAQVEGVHVPAGLTFNHTDRHEVRSWLWRVILADGTRTLTTAGRWAEALAHIEEHRGVGQRMLDGRQVAVLATLCRNPTDAAALVAETTPGDPWENAVTSCLHVMCDRSLHRPVNSLLDALVDDYVEQQPNPGAGTTVFDTRLDLTILDLLDPRQDEAAHQMTEELHRRTITTADGYAARECLATPRFASHLTLGQDRAIRELVHACALQRGSLPELRTAQITKALRISDEVIRKTVTGPQGQPGATTTKPDA
ncbi:hypothetical protein RVR_2397 [Actinacidiphila reveromycinica]|uniref:Uncharacterized protein n=1 Tax=Actinacidiphila reveromycinica TaxID=659352 RepID=A0A7U3UQJ7_9ACTN|nr:hypothetical protein [Streptomyces sp. SN-593]BBA96893.1 hypothetical protein RVR_2397 [Streptomyces sp. SN-593]